MTAAIRDEDRALLRAHIASRASGADIGGLLTETRWIARLLDDLEETERQLAGARLALDAVREVKHAGGERL